MSEASTPALGDALTPPGGSPPPTGAARNARLIAAGIFVSRIFGLVRTWAFARYFGGGMEADAYIAALKIPNFVRNLLGEGAISASFIPVYSAALGRGDDRAARALAGALLGLLLAAVSALTLIGVALAPLLVDLFAGGFAPEARDLTTRLVRILFPMTGLMVISGWCLGIQNSHRRFFVAYASAALWSVAQIALLFASGFLGSPPLDRLVVWFAWATMAGSLLQVAAQVPEVVRLVRPLRVTLDRSAPGLAETARNFIPVVMALGVLQVSGFIDLRIASELPESATSSLNYAAQIYLLPVSMFGLSVAASSLPDLARESATAIDALLARLRDGWVRILFYVIPTTAVFMFFGDLVITLLLRSGEFSGEDVRVVSWILRAYAVGLIAASTVRLLTAGFYAVGDYRTPLRASIAAIVTGAVLAIALAWQWRESVLAAAGIALGSALGTYVNLVMLNAALRRRFGALFTGAMWRGTTRIIVAAGTASLGAWGIRATLESGPGQRLLLGGVPDVLARIAAPEAVARVVVALGTLIVFGGIFLVSAYAGGSQEAARWLARVVRRPPTR